MIALVLGGGGTKGDFQVGAAKYIYQELGVRPNLIIACSAGSLNGAKLAEGGDDAPARLEAIWHHLDTNADMYHFEQWVLDLEPRLREIVTQCAVAAASLILNILNPIGILMTLTSLIHETVEDLKRLEARLRTARSVYNLGPIASLLGHPANFDEQRIRSSPIDLRLAVVGLESGKLRFVSKDGRVEGLNEPPVPLVDAVLASAAIPFVFPPVKLGSETYVDGGVREMVPIQAAVTAGADRIFALVAAKGGVGPMGSFDRSNILDITKRVAADLMPDEIQRNETHPDGLGWPSTVTVIQPRIDIHDGLTVHPGLISLAIDYGWMCACDAAGAPANLTLCVQATDHLTLLRKQIVEREEGDLSHVRMWLRLRGMKRRLAQLVSLRLAAGGRIPTGTDWWRRWERHRRAWGRPTASPWDVYQLRPYPEPDYVPAEEPPSVASAAALATATYGSTIVLGHWLTGSGLYSDAWTYRHTGTSGQQRVLALDESDGNDAWRVKGPHSQWLGYRWGEPVRDGDVIRLEHVRTRRNLHSHAGLPSPATGQQEVTCSGEQGVGDANDDWRVHIEGGGTWVLGKRLRLIHVLTNHALHSHVHHYMHKDVHEDAGPLTSLQEVTAFPSQDDNDWWFMIQATPLPAGVVQWQPDWRWCHKCHGLFFAGGQAFVGSCPAGGQHDKGGSGDYTLAHNLPEAPGQPDWRWCHKCHGLFFAGGQAFVGSCPAGGQHDKGGSGNYTLAHNLPEAPGQPDWRWCHKCHGLFFAGGQAFVGSCPAGGQHDKEGSGNYTLVHHSR